MDRILTSRPVNRQAAMVTARGIHWEPAKNLTPPGFVRLLAPPPMRPIPNGYRPEENITGLKVDRLTVIGLAENEPGKSGARWVVRCSCGAYEQRRWRFLVSDKAKARAMCSHCGYTREMLAGHVP